jgi:hypothetical protein
MSKLKLKYKDGQWEILIDGKHVENVMSLELVASATEKFPVVNLKFYDPELDIEGDVDLYERG